MSTVTPKLGLTKPAGIEQFNLATLNNNMDLIDAGTIPSITPTVTALTLSTGWKHKSGGFAVPSAYKVGHVIYLQGMITNINAGSWTANAEIIIAQIPTGQGLDVPAGKAHMHRLLFKTPLHAVFEGNLVVSATAEGAGTNTIRMYLTNSVASQPAESMFLPLDGISFLDV